MGEPDGHPAADQDIRVPQPGGTASAARQARREPRPALCAKQRAAHNQVRARERGRLIFRIAVLEHCAFSWLLKCIMYLYM